MLMTRAMRVARTVDGSVGISVACFLILAASCAKLSEPVPVPPSEPPAAPPVESAEPSEPIPGITLRAPAGFERQAAGEARVRWRSPQTDDRGVEIELRMYRLAPGLMRDLASDASRSSESPTIRVVGVETALLSDFAVPGTPNERHRLVRMRTPCGFLDLELRTLEVDFEKHAARFGQVLESLRVDGAALCQAPAAKRDETAASASPAEAPRTAPTEQPSPKALPTKRPTSNEPPTPAVEPTEPPAPALEPSEASAPPASEASSVRAEIAPVVEKFVRGLRGGDRSAVLAVLAAGADDAFPQPAFDALRPLVRRAGAMNQLRLKRNRAADAAHDWSAEARVDWPDGWRPVLQAPVTTAVVEARDDGDSSLRLYLSLRREQGVWRIVKARFSAPKQ